MRITAVSYRRLRTFGNYQNETVGAEAALEEEDTPDAVLDGLKAWVHSRLEMIDVREDMREDLYRLESEKHALERDIHDLNTRREAAKMLLEAHGGRVEEFDVPF